MSSSKPRVPSSEAADALNFLGAPTPGGEGEQASGQNGNEQDNNPGQESAKDLEPQKKVSGRHPANLADRLLAAAAWRIGYVLRPFPKDASKADIETALEALKQRSLIHYPSEHPNLTPAGIIVARKLAGIED